MLKYKLLVNDTITIDDNIILYRIQRLSDNSLGGYIQTEQNLSQESNCWVYGNARVYGNAQVYGDAQISGDARVSGDAQIFGNARVYGTAQIAGDAQISGDARVYSDAWVYGTAQIAGDARVYDTARVFGDARVYDKAEVYGTARINKFGDYLFIGGHQFNVTIVPGLYIQIGCKTKTKQEWLLVTEQQATSDGLNPEFYQLFRNIITLLG